MELKGKVTVNKSSTNSAANDARFQCKLCKTIFNDFRALNSHMSRHTKEKPFKCDHCDKCFPAIGRLNSHVNEVHKRLNAVQCEYPNCGKTFVARKALIRHAVLHDVESEKHSLVSCPICNVKVKEMYLKNHVKNNHDSSKRHKCDICSKLFSTITRLKNHKNIHLPESERARFPCEFCKKTFSCSYSAKVHSNKLHSASPRKYSCSFCSKVFKESQWLTTHVRTHTGEKPYACSHCDMHFINKRALDYHFKAKHATEKEFKCQYCSKEFIQNKSLKSHLLTHSDEKNYKCDLCGKGFKTGSNLSAHKATIHSNSRKIHK